MADEHPSGASGAFRRPFVEQVAFFRRKMGHLAPTRRWDDLTGAQHDTAFMVAGAQKAALLSDLAGSIDQAIAGAGTLETFTRDFNAAVDRHDWHGWTGEGTKGGRAWRVRTIYRTNAFTSYAAGRFAQLTAAGFKYWVYLHGGSRDPRPEHLNVFNGLILPPDHPFWEKHYPPSDWGCSCYVVGAFTLKQAQRLGGTKGAEALPDGWDKPLPATGEPAGIGKGWGYAPGASVAAAVSDAAKSWPAEVAEAFAAYAAKGETATADAAAIKVGSGAGRDETGADQSGGANGSVPPPPPTPPPPGGDGRGDAGGVVRSVADLTDRERQVFTGYTSGDHLKINGGLKSGTLTPEAAIIDAVLARAVFQETIVVYRGLGEEEAAALLAAAPAPGTVIREPIFGSTSRSPSVARRFMGRKPPPRLLLIIHLAQDSPALDIASISAHRRQREILLQRGTWMRVLRLDEANGTCEVEVGPDIGPQE